MELIPCTICKRYISATALACPSCGTSNDPAAKSFKSATTAAKWVAVSAIAVALGPAAILGGILGASVSGGPSKKQLRKVVQDIDAVDALPLGHGWIVFFTRDGWNLLGTCHVADWDEQDEGSREPVFYSSFISVAIDESLTKRKAFSKREIISLILKAKPSQKAKELYRFKKENNIEVAEWVFPIEGKKARQMAEFACAKFEEYAWGYSSE